MTALALTMSVIVLAGCGSKADSEGSAAPPTTTKEATRAPAVKTATIKGIYHAIGYCDYGNMHPGETVVVLDGAGKLLGQGKTVDDPSFDEECHETFTVKNVPEGASGYQIQIGDQDPIHYNWVQLKEGPDIVLTGD